METDSPQVEPPVKKQRAPRKAKIPLELVVLDPQQPEPEPEPEPKRQRRAAPRPRAPPPELPTVEVDANFMASLTGTLRTMQKNERSSKIASLKIA